MNDDASAASSAFRYHHLALHRLLDIGFTVQYDTLLDNVSRSKSCTIADGGVLGISGGGIITSTANCPFCVRQALSSATANGASGGGSSKKPRRGRPQQQQQRRRRSSQRRVAGGGRGGVLPLSALKGSGDLGEGDGDEAETAAPVHEYCRSFRIPSLGTVFTSHQVSQLCVGYAMQLGLATAMESYLMVVLLQKAPSSPRSTAAASTTTTSAGSLPSLPQLERGATTALTSAPLPDGFPSSSHATAAAAAAASPVAVGFFTLPSCIQMAQLDEPSRASLLSHARYPSSSLAGITPLSCEIIHFQHKKELLPSMRDASSPHPLRELGAVCCCDVFIVLRQHEEPSVWGLSDPHSHLHMTPTFTSTSTSTNQLTSPISTEASASTSTGGVMSGIVLPHPSSRVATPSFEEQSNELFHISNRLEDYFRLGAAFGWVYGWQMCYASLGPPLTSIPWLRLVNASAFQATTALRASFQDQ